MGEEARVALQALRQKYSAAHHAPLMAMAASAQDPALRQKVSNTLSIHVTRLELCSSSCPLMAVAGPAQEPAVLQKVGTAHVVARGGRKREPGEWPEPPSLVQGLPSYQLCV